MKFFKPLYCLLSITTGALTAQQGTMFSPKIYTTLEIETTAAPSIDGALDDSIWASVEWGTNFIEVAPDENAEPPVQTKFKIIYPHLRLG